MFAFTSINNIKFIKITSRLFFLAGFTLTLMTINGCSTVNSSANLNDGAPIKPDNQKINEAKNAVPKHEPKSKYGNPKSYNVLGKNYNTLNHSNGFKQTGFASWYGTKFHGRKTSSGEPYDMYAMTGAHKTLPLPTYAKITNKENNKSIIIKINDRGPFHDNRILDLSYAAAAKLGVLSRGTAKIELAAIDPLSFNKVRPKDNKYNKHIKNNIVSAAITKEPSYKSVVVQIGAFTEKHLAEKLVNSASNIIDHPIKIYNDNTNNKSLYRVHLGPFPESNLSNIRSKLADIKIFNLITINQRI